MLHMIGIDSEAERVYEALLEVRQAGPLELAAATGLTTERIRVALCLLESRGLTSRMAGPPQRYRAVEPGMALDVLLLDRETELQRARARARELTEVFRRTVATQDDPTELVEVVTGNDATAQRLEQAQRSIRSVARCLDKPPYAEDFTRPNPAELELLGRGGTVRTVYSRSAVEIPGRLSHLEQVVACGEQARVLPTLPTKLLLVDDRLAVVPLQTAPAAIESGVIVHPSALLDALSSLFETLWTLALPVELATGTESSNGRPTSEEQQILAMMSAGLPDESISRQLHMSYRTLQRRIHDLMERLHVQTRFQLGAQAIRQSWVRPPAT